MNKRKQDSSTTFIRFFCISFITTITLITLISCDALTSIPSSTATPISNHTIPPPSPTQIAITPSPMNIEIGSVSPTPTMIPSLTPTPFPTVTSPLDAIPSYPTLSVTEEVSFELVNQWGGRIETIAISGDTAYAGEGMHLTILNIADPSAPELQGQSPVFSDIVHAVVIQDDIAYLGVGTSVISLDISNPQLPKTLAELILPGPVTHLALEEDILVVGISFAPSDSHENGLGLLATVRITQPDQLQQLDTVILPWNINAMALANETVYASNPADETFYAVNISDPTNLPDPSAFSVAPLTYSLQVQDQTLFVGGGLSNVSAWKIDLPSEPEKLWEIQAEPDSDLGLGVVEGFVIIKNHAYLGVVNYHGQTIGPLALETPILGEVTQDTLASSPIAYQDEYIYFADRGLTIYSALDGNLTLINGFAKPEAWDVATTDSAGVFIDGNAPQNNNGSTLYTVSLPDLSILGQYTDENRCQQCNTSFIEISITNNIAYVSALDNGLRTINLADLDNPELLGSLDETNGISDLRLTGLAVSNKQIFATNGSCAGHNLMILDLLDSHIPQLTSRVELDGCIEKLVIKNDILYAAVNDSDGEGSKLYLFDIANMELSELGLAALSENVNDIRVVDTTAILATSEGIKVFATNEPADIKIIGEFPVPGGVYEMAGVDNNIVFLTTIDASSKGLLALDLTTPSMPRLVGSFDLPVKGEISMAGEYLLVGNPVMGLAILQVTQ